MKFCKVGFHKWSKWSKLKLKRYEKPKDIYHDYGGVTFTYTSTMNETQEFSRYEQTKKCEWCNIMQIRVAYPQE